MARVVTDVQLRRRLAANVRQLRLRADLTIEKASERADISTRQWDRLEAGTLNTTLHTLVRVGRALSTDPAELLRAS
jgi:transcriptional regulator with XRE-family HTH domain